MQVASIFQIMLFFTAPVSAYNQPYVGLGATSFLDGGPLRPAAGWYYEQFFDYYYTNRFLDNHGKPLDKKRSPVMNNFIASFEGIYQSNLDILGGKLGVSALLPVILYSKTTRNRLGFTNSGSGFGDLDLGIYIQWPTYTLHNKPIFVHRLEFAVSFPTGKYDRRSFFNPGNGFLYYELYWASTLYLTQKFSFSSRYNYLWNRLDKKTKIRAGDAFYMHFALEYEALERFYVGINNYFFQQLKDDRLCGKILPDSKERVFGSGPGFLWTRDENFHLVLIGNLYFETAVRNRTQGFKAFLRIFTFF